MLGRFGAAKVGYSLLAALYLLSFPYHAKLRSPNELCRLWQARSIVEDGSLVINGVMQRYGGVGDLSVKDGRYYPSKAPLLSFLATPLYAAQRAVLGRAPDDVSQVFLARLLITILPTLVMLIFLRRFLMASMPQGVADLLVVTYGLGTMAFSYSEMFLSHQLTAVLGFACFYAAWRTLRGDWNETKGFLVSGAFAGAVVACEYTGALTVVAIAVYVAVALWADRRRLVKAAGLVLAGGAPFLLALMAYHQACFGGPFTSGYKYLADAGYQPWHLGGFLGIRVPDPRAFVLSFFSPLRGLFTTSPFLILALPGLAVLRPQRPLFVFTLVLLLANAYFTSSFAYDSWGWALAPRHLAPMLPFLLLPIGLLMVSLSERTQLDAQVGLGFSMGICAASVLTMGLDSFINYVPDSTSTTLYGLFWPLVGQGYLPLSALEVFGLRSPWLGALLIGLVLVVAAWVAVSCLRFKHTRWVAAALLLGVLGHQMFLVGATRKDAADLGVQSHLKSVW